VIVTDLTESVAAAQALRQARDDLGERVKELTVLQRASYLLQDHARPSPSCYQSYSSHSRRPSNALKITAARIVFGDDVFATPNYAPSPRMLWRTWANTASSKYATGREAREAEGPFLAKSALSSTHWPKCSRRTWNAGRSNKSAPQVRCASARWPKTTSAAIFIVEGLRILYANEAAHGATGYMCDECSTWSCGSWLIPPIKVFSDNTACICGMRPFPAGSRSSGDQAGEDCWWDVTEHGSIEYGGKSALVVTAFDITERDRAEKELAKKPKKS